MKSLVLIMGLSLALGGCAFYKSHVVPAVNSVCGEEAMMDLNVGPLSVSFDCSLDKPAEE